MALTDILALRRPTDIWTDALITSLYEACQSAMNFVDNTSMEYEKYGHCLRRGREVIIEKMMDFIMNTAYFNMQYDSTRYVLYWRDAPLGLTTFVRHLETVFTGDKEIKIRKKNLAVAVATSAVANAPLPKPTRDWSENEIKSMYDACQRAMKLLDSDPTIISEEYRQCLQRRRDALIQNIMDFIMDTRYFKTQHSSSSYVLFWKDAPEGLARFLQHMATVFTGDEEVKIRTKRTAPKEQEAMPPIASIVAFVEAPDPRLKSGILRAYGKMKFFSANDKLPLEALQGKRILDEKWAEGGETYNLTGETKAILCTHLWSLMRYAGFSKSDKIWEVITKAWPECVSWEKGYYGHFWQIIYSEEVPLRVQAEIKGLKTILDAYKDMERYFNFKGDNQHFLINWPSAYYPNEDNPNPSINLWEDILTEITDIS